MTAAPGRAARRRTRRRDVEPGLRFAGLALAVNSLMAAIKIGVGLFSGSHAVLASALYSINDILSALAISVSLRVGNRRATKDYPYGFGKAEFIAVGIVSLTIAIGVFCMFFFSVVDIVLGVDGPPHMVALTLAAASLGVSWTLSRKGHRLAADLESPALMTSADHHQADAEGSFAAIIGVGGALLGFHVLDRVVAIFETLHIVALSGTLLAKAVKGLMDTALPEEDVELLEQVCVEVPGVERLVRIWSRRVGSDTWVDLAVAVPAGLTVERAHEVRKQVSDAVRRVLGPAAAIQVRFQAPEFVEARPGPGGSPHG